MKKTIIIIVDRLRAPTPTFWKKTRNYMLAIGGASAIIILGGAFLPLLLVKLAGYGATTGAIGTALSQLAKVKDDDNDEEVTNIKAFDMKIIRTVKDLQEAIATLPPETIVLAKDSNTMELGDEITEGAYFEVSKYKPEMKNCRDAFDGVNYKTKVYKSDDEGTEYLVIR